MELDTATTRGSLEPPATKTQFRSSDSAQQTTRPALSVCYNAPTCTDAATITPS